MLYLLSAVLKQSSNWSFVSRVRCERAVRLNGCVCIPSAATDKKATLVSQKGETDADTQALEQLRNTEDDSIRLEGLEYYRSHLATASKRVNEIVILLGDGNPEVRSSVRKVLTKERKYKNRLSH